MKIWKKKIIIIGIECLKVIAKYLIPALAGYLEGSEQVISGLFGM